MLRKKYLSLIMMSLLLATFFTAFISSSQTDNNTPIEVRADTTLTILTRHDFTITNRFKNEFLATPEAQALNITDIDFRHATTDAGWQTLLQDPSHSVDIAWGGGPYLFDKMASLDLLFPINPINDSELYSAIDDNVPDVLANISMKKQSDAGDFLWVANTLSSFGLIVNHNFLDSYGLPIPTTWSDLANPVYYINPSVTAIAIGDPPLTTSHTRIYQIILQAFGWEKGWEILTRIAGNANIFPGSVDVDVAIRDEAAGIALSIDFYGVVAQNENPDCEYIIPKNQSIIEGDPIALGCNVDDYDAAVAFIKYVLSPEGQTTWMTPGLDRLPVNASAFDTPLGSTYIQMKALYEDTILNIGIPLNYTLAKANLDTTIYYFHNQLTQRYDLLREVWGEIVTHLRAGNINSTQFTLLAAILGLPTMTLQESIDWNEQYINDETFAAEKDSEWRSFASTKYNFALHVLTDMITSQITTTPIITTEPIETTMKINFDWLLSLSSLLLIPCLLLKRRKRQIF